MLGDAARQAEIEWCEAKARGLTEADLVWMATMADTLFQLYFGALKMHAKTLEATYAPNPTTPLS